MKEKIAIVICTILVFAAGLMVGSFIMPKCKTTECNCQKEEKPQEEEKIENIEIKYNKGKKYYIIKNDYKGEYDYQEVSMSEYFESDDALDRIKLFNTTEILSFSRYKEFCERWNIERKYDDTNMEYMVVAYAAYGQPVVHARLANAITNDGTISLYMWENVRGITADIQGYVIVVPVDFSVYKHEINIAYTEEEFNNIVMYGSTQDPNQLMADKPIIYIYPEEETNVSVKLLNSELLTVSYPKYNNGWSVIAKPDGTLKDLTTNRNYYGLYYEGKNHQATMQDDGFIIKGEDVAKFLEEKLEILGLNEREANEFIIYWLPKLESNKYNYIRFEPAAEIEEYMPLEITPKPDTIIRVMMDYKPLTEKIEINEQILKSQTRTGYSVVEWGGSEIHD
jgi:hypothetical protein